MFRSVFLRKMIFLVLVALCASALISATLFNYAETEIERNSAEEHSIEQAKALSSFLSSYLSSNSASGKDQATLLRQASAGY